ncbi:MAG: hotdog domain-containing protein, partial [Bacilli bacterium]
VFGDIVDLELEKSGLSVWRADKEHVFARSSIVRGHYIFAQANSLAVAIVDASQALTAKATIRFLRSARVGAYLVARARVCGKRHGYVLVEVRTKVDGEEILRADFLIMRGIAEAPGRVLFENRD